MPRVADIAAVLTKYRGRFDSLDAFADDVDDLREGTWRGKVLAREPHPLLSVLADDTALSAEVFPGSGVVRFRLAPAGPSPASADGAVALGALLGAALGAASEKKEGLLGGLLLGMLVGGAVGAASTKPVERVLALRFEPTTRSWHLYDGALLQWAKHAMQPGPTAA